MSAQECHSRGRDLAEGPDFSKEKLFQAVELFEQAIRLDHSFADAGVTDHGSRHRPHAAGPLDLQSVKRELRELLDTLGTAPG